MSGLGVDGFLEGGKERVGGGMEGGLWYLGRRGRV